MTSAEFRERLSRRAERVRLTVADDLLGPLESYFRLLAQWNRTINLTALPLDEPTDETFDRLFVEPLAADRWMSGASEAPDRLGLSWVDLGSGGGSPAIPMKVARPELPLVMVESRVRKAAFLREVLRTLNLRNTTVENVRFEQLEGRFEGSATQVTARAVRADDVLFAAAARLLRSNGRLVLFAGGRDLAEPAGFSQIDTVQISDSNDQPAVLHVFRRLA